MASISPFLLFAAARFLGAPHHGTISGSRVSCRREVDGECEHVHVGGTKKSRGRGQSDRSEDIEEEASSGKAKRISTRIGSAGAART
jgi:hypothetical protein